MSLALMGKRADQYINTKVNYLWRAMGIAKGKPTLWAGDVGVGKSQALTRIAAYVSRGRPPVIAQHAEAWIRSEFAKNNGAIFWSALKPSIAAAPGMTESTVRKVFIKIGGKIVLGRDPITGQMTTSLWKLP